MLVMFCGAGRERVPGTAGNRDRIRLCRISPHYMGYGPVVATQKLMAQTGLSLKDFDLIEINEAFAAEEFGLPEGLRPG